jgi:hypothetical protein
MNLDYYYLLDSGKPPPDHEDPNEVWRNIFIPTDKLINTLEFAGIS